MLANTLVGYLICIDVGDDALIFVSPTISCNSNDYIAWLPAVIILLISLIILPPVLLLIWLARNRHRFIDSQFADRWGILYESYTPRAYWWQSMVLIRRVIFSVVDIAMVVLPHLKFMIFAFIHLLSLFIHQLVAPYQQPFFNQVELITLLSLTSLAVIMTAYPDPRQIQALPAISILITVLVVIPIIGFCIVGCHAIINKFASVTGKGKGQSRGGKDSQRLSSRHNGRAISGPRQLQHDNHRIDEPANDDNEEDDDGGNKDENKRTISSAARIIIDNHNHDEDDIKASLLSSQ
jgi:hypothetical protein